MLIEHLLKPRDWLFLVVMLALFAIPVVVSLNSPTYVEVLQEGGTLRVVTRVSPSTYYEDDDQAQGFEYELSKRLADFLGVELELIPVDSLDDLKQALRLENAHLAAAGLTRTEARQDNFDFAPPYRESSQLLIYRHDRKTKPPKSLPELAGKRMIVMANSSHAQHLKSLQQDHPSLRWEETTELEVLDLLKQVSEGELDYTVVDSHEFEVNSVYFPNLRKAFAISQPQPIAWMIKNRQDKSWQRTLHQFFDHPDTKTAVNRLNKKYFSRDERLDLVDSLTFQKHLRTRLPRYLDWFLEAAEETGIDWELLAAIGYQESHWNPRAVSPTGVRGLMMLTQQTAKEVGIKKRTDAQQSIRGGARYFAKTWARIPERISEPDRTWLALAAYNVGMGHLEDARVLTQRAGENPDSWKAIKKHLPKLAQPRWFKTVRHGYARGYEPVVYVSNIRRYLKRLQWEAQYQAVLQGKRPGEVTPQQILQPVQEKLPSLPDTL